MIFVDTNVIMYAVGRVHPLRAEACAFFLDATRDGLMLCTSAEVLQELMHAYLLVDRLGTLDAALELVSRSIHAVWDLEAADVRLARLLVGPHPGLSARDLLHLASCRRRKASDLRTFDRALKAAWASKGP
jgi:uncharacterized protein